MEAMVGHFIEGKGTKVDALFCSAENRPFLSGLAGSTTGSMGGRLLKPAHGKRRPKRLFDDR